MPVHPSSASSRPAARTATQVRALLILATACLGAATPARAASPDDSTAVILWEAPGDDGMEGRATRYELRYRPAPIAGTDTLSWWNAAHPVEALPTPGLAGATDSMAVSGLDPYQAYYFILRAADEAANWSAFSNLLVKPPALDVWPPARVADLAAAP